MAGKVKTTRPNKGAGQAVPTKGTPAKGKPAARKPRAKKRGQGAQNNDRIAAVIEHAIDAIQTKLASDDAKHTVADLVRLLQLQKDMEGKRPIDVTVRWVEEECSENSSTDE